MVLFDFQDIESYDPDGNYHDTTDACDWCVDWCTRHPTDCPDDGAGLPGCAHSPDGTGDPRRRFNCVVKARAFWWMMARLAGWNGQ